MFLYICMAHPAGSTPRRRSTVTQQGTSFSHANQTWGEASMATPWTKGSSRYPGLSQVEQRDPADWQGIELAGRSGRSGGDCQTSSLAWQGIRFRLSPWQSFGWHTYQCVLVSLIPLSTLIVLDVSSRFESIFPLSICPPTLFTFTFSLFSPCLISIVVRPNESIISLFNESKSDEQSLSRLCLPPPSQFGFVERKKLLQVRGKRENV